MSNGWCFNAEVSVRAPAQGGHFSTMFACGVMLGDVGVLGDQS